MSAKESPPDNKFIAKLFDAKEIGSSLSAVAVEMIQSEGREIESHWFHSKKDADLFFWKDKDKNIIKQQVVFYGQLIEWNIVEGLRTGLLIEDETSQKMGSSPLIRFDDVPQKLTIHQGVRIISHVTTLKPDDKNLLIDNFTKSTSFSDLSPEEAIRRFGKYNVQKPKKIKFKSWIEDLLGFFKIKK